MDSSEKPPSSNMKPYTAWDESPKGHNAHLYETKETSAVQGMPNNEEEGNNTVKRDLEQRHISMIAIGGTIGTGLFLGMGEALNKGGPVGLILGYSVMGLVVYSMTIALGEMVTMFPVSGSLTHYPSRFVDRSLGFAVGWNYWYSLVTAIPSEIIAAAIVVDYWKVPVNRALWVTLFIVLGCAFNFFGVRWYGETEFIFAAIKVVAVVMLLIVGIVIDLGGGPNHDRVGFRNLKNPGPFNQLNGIPGVGGRFLAFWSVFIQAVYSFIGTEMVAITAGEAANPRKTVPKAIERVFYRILVFYLGSTTLVGLLVPYTSPELLGGTGDAASSPFVIAIKQAGISVLPDIVNLVILLSSLSAASSKLYGASRILFGLSNDGMSPRIFRKCTKNGLPMYALLASFGVVGLSYMCMNSKSSIAFNWFQNLSAISGLVTWWSILVSYIFFYQGLKVQGYNRDNLHYKAPFQPYASYFSLFMLTIITLMSGFETFLKGNWSFSTFASNYLLLPVFIGMYFTWKIIHKTKFVKPSEMDFVTGTRELDEMEAEEKSKIVEPTTKLGKFMDWVSFSYTFNFLMENPKLIFTNVCSYYDKN
ncbi:amino acid permease-domain-containing protein [Phakopsora pachyrhizi]|uniref:Amino acid permease-domain-containing protein n=1 Tax=Phakopsora pachyrhizi TaxID=170000 RepID=A0AAV0ATM0_PHAPC|nr:amino acid permease-domain-containing protein [Phakopsora pachyrhizi]